MKKNVVISGMLLVFALIATAASLAVPAGADDSLKAQGLVDKSYVTFRAFMADPDMIWLHEHVRDARGVIIIPQMLKGGFFLGGSGGSGVLVIRDEKTGEWSEPAFYNIGSVSFGLQIGASAAEVVMLAMSQRAVDALLTTSFKIGGDVSAAIGPVGSGAAAKGLRADLISYAKAKGAYLGISLEGAVVDNADSMSRAYYGQNASPTDILIRHDVKNPQADELRAAITKAAK